MLNHSIKRRKNERNTYSFPWCIRSKFCRRNSSHFFQEIRYCLDSPVTIYNIQNWTKCKIYYIESGDFTQTIAVDLRCRFCIWHRRHICHFSSTCIFVSFAFNAHRMLMPCYSTSIAMRFHIQCVHFHRRENQIITFVFMHPKKIYIRLRVLRVRRVLTLTWSSFQRGSVCVCVL